MNAFAFRGLPAGIAAIETLAALPHWVAWTYENRGDSNATKPPIDPHTGLRASHSDPRTWGTYEQATETAIDRDLAGVGFVLTADDRFTGIDLDNCIRDDGALEPWVVEVVALGETYTEISPSGRGLRMIAVGKVARAVKYDPAGVEIYGQQRYLTITGNHWPGTPREIWEAPRTIAMLVARVETMKAANGGARQTREHKTRGSFGLENFYDRVKAAALADIGAWVGSLFPTARFQPGTGAWRVSSADLGRDLQEDISIHPDGIKDFGIHDMGDQNEGGRTAIDLVIEHGDSTDAAEAALWLCQKLQIEPASLGWQGENDEDPADAETDGEPFDFLGKFVPPPLPQGVLPLVIEHFARSQGRLMGCDPAAIAMACLTCAAAAIPDTIRLRMKRHDDSWHEVARLWTALVGDPSRKKTPAMNRALDPVNRINARLLAHYLEQKRAWDALTKEERKDAERPKKIRLRIGDISIEALQDILVDTHTGVLLVRDELSGWFGAMDAYASNGRSGKDGSFYLECYNGGMMSIDRIGRDTGGGVPNASASVLGGIQPDKIRDYAGKAQEDGLMARLTPVIVGPASSELDEAQPGDFGHSYNRLIERLYALPGSSAVTDDEGRVTLIFDDAAQAIRNEAAEQYRLLMNVETFSTKLANHIGKYAGIFGRLCVVFHCIENAPGGVLPVTINANTAKRVDRFIDDFLLPHAFVFYFGTLRDAEGQGRLEDMAGYILAKRLEYVRPSDYQRASYRVRTMERLEFQRVMERLESASWVREVPAAQKKGGVRWKVNPLVHERFKDWAREAQQRLEKGARTVEGIVSRIRKDKTR